jgi:CBS domain-containing protein
MTTTEAVGVISLIVIGAFVVINALGSSSYTVFNSLATEMNDSVVDADIASLSNGEAAGRLVYADQHQSSIALLVSLTCLLLLGWLYLRLWRQRKEELRDSQEQVKEIEQKSFALHKILNKRNSIFNLIDENWESILSGHATVGTFMSTSVVTIEESTPKYEALEKMKKQGFRRFMVVSSAGNFVGVVSKQDIVSKEGENVSDVMTSDPKITKPTTEIHTAVSVLLENRISCLPVVQDGVLVGLLSVTDLLMVLQCLLVDLRMRSERRDSSAQLV